MIIGEWKFEDIIEGVNTLEEIVCLEDISGNKWYQPEEMKTLTFEIPWNEETQKFYNCAMRIEKVHTMVSMLRSANNDCRNCFNRNDSGMNCELCEIYRNLNKLCNEFYDICCSEQEEGIK